MANSIDRDTLKKKSASLKDAITHNFDDFKSNTEDISKAAIIGGGVLLAGYIIYRLLRTQPKPYTTDSEKQIVVVNGPNQDSIIVRNIKNAIATFILAIAKQKLAEYLDNRERKMNENV